MKLAAAARLQEQYRQLQERNERLETELQDKANNLAALRKGVEQRQQDLERLELQVQQVEATLAEKEKFAQELRVRAGTRVKLDVGGVFFTTSVTTLLSHPESMLAAMFSGRHELETDDEGRVFIDRDGKLFKYVLQYLRDGDLDVSAIPAGVKERLKREAAFYCLPELAEKLSTVATKGLLPDAVFLRISAGPGRVYCDGPDPIKILPRLPSTSGVQGQGEAISFVLNTWLPALMDAYETAGYKLKPIWLKVYSGTYYFYVLFQKK